MSPMGISGYPMKSVQSAVNEETWRATITLGQDAKIGCALSVINDRQETCQVEHNASKISILGNPLPWWNHEWQSNPVYEAKWQEEMKKLDSVLQSSQALLLTVENPSVVYQGAAPLYKYDRLSIS